MAKKTMDWDFTKDGILTCTHKDVTPEKKVDFDLTEFFEDFSELTEIQQNIIVYGIKQKLADACAVQKPEVLTTNERIVTMSNVWSRLKDGVWTQKGGDRQTLKKTMQSGLDALTAEAKAAITPELRELLKKQGLNI